MFFCLKTLTMKMMFLLCYALCASAAPTPVSKKTPKKKTDVHWSRLVTVTRQLDAIDREAWWVLIEKRPPLTQSIFGKIQRAAQSEEGQKLTQKNLFSCDKYNLTRKILSPTGFPQQISAYHSCRKDQELFAEIQWKQKEKLEFTFLPGPLVDVLGLNASILGRKIVCEVNTDAAGIVQNFSCKNMTKDRNSQELVELDVYEFKKQDSSQLSLKGKVTENLTIKRKIESLVPLAGKIKVTETEILPPPGYKLKSSPGKSSKVSPTAPPAVAAPSVNPPEPTLPLENPDQLVKKIEQQQERGPISNEANPFVPFTNEGPVPLAEPEYIEDTTPPASPLPQGQPSNPPSRR